MKHINVDDGATLSGGAQLTLKPKVLNSFSGFEPVEKSFCLMHIKFNLQTIFITWMS